jgi:hypothetical protein
LGQGSLYIEEWNQQLRDQSWLIKECNTYCWCDIVLNVHATNEDKRNDSKDSFYEEFEQVLLLLVAHVLGNFDAKLGRQNIFKVTIGNESLYEGSNDNSVKVVNFGISKNLVANSTMFPHQNIHKYIWTSPDGKTQNQMIKY